MKKRSNRSEPMVPEGISDAECVQRLQRGETDAFETLVRRHQKTIFNLVYRMLGDYDEAAEVSQEVFLSAFRAIGQFRGAAHFSTWLYRIAVNHASTRRRSATRWSQRTVPVEESELVGDGRLDPAQMVERKELQERVQEALARLEPQEATVIVLRDLQDVPYEEVARVLGVPVGTVKSRLHRARQSLKDRLAAYVKVERGKP